MRCGAAEYCYSDFVVTAYIGMGANVASWAGEPEVTLAAAAERLESLGRVMRRSSLFSTEPVGFAEQPRFLNAVVALDTDLLPHELLEGLLDLEKEFGRDRSAGIPNGPRTLDLDILLFGGLKVSGPGLEVPHPRLSERGFVLVPLNEIASNVEDAGPGMSVKQLLYEWLIGHPPETNAVIPFQSDVWRAGVSGIPAEPSTADRAGLGPADSDGGR